MLAYSLFATLIIAVLIITAMFVVSYRQAKERVEHYKQMPYRCNIENTGNPENSKGKSGSSGNPSDSEHPETENAGDGDERYMQQTIHGILQKYVKENDNERAAIYIIRNEAGIGFGVIGRSCTTINMVATTLKNKEHADLGSILRAAYLLSRQHIYQRSSGTC